MKLLVFLTLLMLLPGLADDGDKEGRRGNTLYKKQLYEAAADAYYAGLATYKEGKTDAAFYGLQNNLGAALHKQEAFDVAQPVFEKAMAAATSDADYARAAYNAGNNAFRSQQIEEALEYYQNALLADPSNLDAKFNYEFVKRQQEQQQQQEQQGQGENEDEEQEQEQSQESNQEQNQDQEQQGEEQQNQDGDQQQPNEQQQDQEQQQPPEPSEQLSRQQAERILQALENEEQQLLREVQKLKGPTRRVEKDW